MSDYYYIVLSIHISRVNWNSFIKQTTITVTLKQSDEVDHEKHWRCTPLRHDEIHYKSQIGKIYKYERMLVIKVNKELKKT